MSRCITNIMHLSKPKQHTIWNRSNIQLILTIKYFYVTLFYLNGTAGELPTAFFNYIKRNVMALDPTKDTK